MSYTRKLIKYFYNQMNLYENPLFAAAMISDLKVFKCCIERGTNINATNQVL